jgi:hypothetical protein
VVKKDTSSGGSKPETDVNQEETLPVYWNTHQMAWSGEIIYTAHAFLYIIRVKKVKVPIKI